MIPRLFISIVVLVGAAQGVGVRAAAAEGPIVSWGEHVVVPPLEGARAIAEGHVAEAMGYRGVEG
jgi:hypothetical protein